jgi:outer membrane lipoprotein-sorting protein
MRTSAKILAIIVTFWPLPMLPTGRLTGAQETCAEAPSGRDEEAAIREIKEKLSPEVRMVLENLEEAAETVTDVVANVTYERAIPLLEEKQRSRGTIRFMKPGLLALELGKPRNEAIYANGKFWWVVGHEEKTVELYKAAELGSGGEAAFLEFGYGGGYDKLLLDYDVALVTPEDDTSGEKEHTTYRLRFSAREDPDGPEAQYAAIEIVVTDERWLPHTIILHESDGKIVHTYAMRRMKLNTGLKEESFTYNPPDDYTLIVPEAEDAGAARP